jgi:hypothetical protein
MSTQWSKRDLLAKHALGAAGLGVGALAVLARTQPVSADTPFTSFPFRATGASTLRTMPDRLSEIKNVKDFGAVGDGTTNDTTAIQNAVNWTTTANRGVIFFPPGTYNITAPITYNYDGELSIIFRGVGRLSKLTGNFAGYILDRSNNNPTSGVRVVEFLEISNSNAAGGGVRMLGTVGGVIQNCQIGSFVGIDCSGGGGACTVQNVVLQGSAAPGSIGILVGGDIEISACDITGFDQGIRAFRVGLSVTGCRLKGNNVGVMLGMDPNGINFQATGFFVGGSSLDSNQTGIYFQAAVGGQIAGLNIGGAASMNTGLKLQGGYSALVSGVSVSGAYSNAAIDASGAGGVTFISCLVNNTGGGARWLSPPSGGITRIQC